MNRTTDNLSEVWGNHKSIFFERKTTMLARVFAQVQPGSTPGGGAQPKFLAPA